MDLNYLFYLVFFFYILAFLTAFFLSSFYFLILKIKGNSIFAFLVKFFKKHKKIFLYIISAALIFINSVFILFSSKAEEYYDSLEILYVFNIFYVIVVSIIYYHEIKKDSEDWYTRNYLDATFLYIEFCSFSPFLVLLFLPQLKYIFVTLMRIQISSEDLLFLLVLSVLTLFMFFGWLMFYSQVKSQKSNIKTIDFIELKIVFLKTSFQSLAAVIALFGLTSWNISITFQLLVFFIDAFVAYSYPLLDISKYVHEKEIEQYKIDERHAPVRRNAESKE